MPDSRDVQLVRRLVRQSFGHHSYPGGIYPQDAEVNSRLEGNLTPIPDELGMRQFRPFLESLGLTPGQVSDAYIRKFRDNCIMRKIGQDQGGQAPTVVTIAKLIAKDVADGTWE